MYASVWEGHCLFMSLWIQFIAINKYSMTLIPKDKSMILLWQDNSRWSTTIPPLKLDSLCNSILFHSLPSKTGTLSKAITYLFPIQAYFAPKWNKTRLMISITLTLLAVYSAWSLGEGAVLHKSRWWRTFTRGMIQWGDWQFVLAHQWGNRASLCACLPIAQLGNHIVDSCCWCCWPALLQV